MRHPRFNRNDEADCGNLTNMAVSFGMQTLCSCGDEEIYHDTLKGESGRCTVYGCQCQQFTPARKPAAISTSATAQEIEPIATLTLEERLVASIAVTKYRKENAA